jgi:hypothetical protein
MNQAQVNFDQYDIRKMNGSVNISAYGSDSIQLAASIRPLTTVNDTIRLRVSGANGNYTMQFNNSDQIAILDNVYLVDEFMSQVIDLRNTSHYTFTINQSNPQSFGTSRFYLLITSQLPSTVPVQLMTFNARATENKKVLLGWATASEQQSEGFEIERSANGNSFQTIGAVKASGNSNNAINYRFEDEHPGAINYYRLKMIDQDGSYTFSETRKVAMDAINEIANLHLFPVPAIEHITLTLNHESYIAQIRVYDMMGELIYTDDTAHGSTAQIELHGWKSGLYILEIQQTDGQIVKQKFSVTK